MLGRSTTAPVKTDVNHVRPADTSLRQGELAALHVLLGVHRQQWVKHLVRGVPLVRTSHPQRKQSV